MNCANDDCPAEDGCSKKIGVYWDCFEGYDKDEADDLCREFYSYWDGFENCSTECEKAVEECSEAAKEVDQVQEDAGAPANITKLQQDLGKVNDNMRVLNEDVKH